MPTTPSEAAERNRNAEGSRLPPGPRGRPSQHRMACARCDFYTPKASSKGQLLEAKDNLQKTLASIPLTDDERAAVDDGSLGVVSLPGFGGGDRLAQDAACGFQVGGTLVEDVELVAEAGEDAGAGAQRRFVHGAGQDLVDDAGGQAGGEQGADASHCVNCLVVVVAVAVGAALRVDQFHPLVVTQQALADSGSTRQLPYQHRQFPPT